MKKVEEQPKKMVLLTTMEVERDERPVLEIEPSRQTDIPEKERKKVKPKRSEVSSS